MVSQIYSYFFPYNYCPSTIPDSNEQLLEHVRALPKDVALKMLTVKAKAISADTLNAVALLEQSRVHFKEARYFLDQAEFASKPNLQRLLHGLIDQALVALDSVISIFSISSLFQPAANLFQSDQKLYRISALMGAFASLAPLVASFFGSTILAGVLFCISAISLVYPKIAPMPRALPYGVNYSQNYKKGLLQIERGREHYLDKMSSVLCRKKRPKHALLYGKAGVGKNELVKGFVKAVHDKKLPGLEGKTVFYFNAADFVNQQNFTGVANPLKEIAEAMGRHRDDMVLIFDEIQTTTTGDGLELSNKLLSMLDDVQEGFPHLIGITTDAGLEEMKKANGAFIGRFEPIKIENPSVEETVSILTRTIQYSPSCPLLENGAATVAEFYQKVQSTFPDSVQPALSLKILKSCIDKTSSIQKLDTESKVEEARAKLDAALALRTMNIFSGLSNSNEEQIDAHEKKLEELMASFEVQKKELRSFFQTKELFAAVQTKLFKTIVKITSNSEVNRLKKFQFLSQFSGYMRQTLKAQAIRCEQIAKIRTTITSALIDEVLAEESAATC